MATYVIDSWPILEWLRDTSPAAGLFQKFLERSVLSGDRLIMSRMNYGEVIYSLAKPVPIHRADELLANMQALPITILSIDDPLVDAAAALKAHHPLSYADCFAAALAIRHDAAVVTGDKEFLALHEVGLVKLEWLGA